MQVYSESFPYNAADIQLSIDLTGIKTPVFDSVVFNASQASITRYYAWSYAHLMEEYLDKAGITPLSLPMINRAGAYVYADSAVANTMYWSHGVASIRVGTAGNDSGNYDIEELGTLLLEALESNDY